MKRAVITGMGAITPLGANLGDFWNGIKDNKIGFSFIDNFETERTGVKIAGFSRDFDETQYYDKEKYFDKKSQRDSTALQNLQLSPQMRLFATQARTSVTLTLSGQALLSAVE